MNFFVPKEYVSENQIVIKGSDVNHIKNVLRHSIGDVLDIVSDNVKYSAKIIEISSDFVRCEIEDVHKEDTTNIKITIIAITNPFLLLIIYSFYIINFIF